jgi:uncharacterized protein (DUF885 family)
MLFSAVNRLHAPSRKKIQFTQLGFLLTWLLLGAPIRSEEVSLNPTADALHRLFAAEWDYQMEQHPTWASVLGDRRWNDRWPDQSVGAIEKRHAHDLAVVAKLKSFDRTALSPSDQLNYDLFLKDYTDDAESFRFHRYLMPLDQRGGIQAVDELADSLRFETLKDYEDWLARLRAFPAYMTQTIALMREGVKERMVLPRIVLERIPAQIDHQIVGDPKTSPFFRPFKNIARSIATADRSRISTAAEQAISSSIVPQFKLLREFFLNDYLPAGTNEVGAWQLPNGSGLYAFLVRRHTTTDLTPEEIHKIGLEEVARIHDEMQNVIDGLGFKGSFQEFAAFLRTDPQFYYRSSEELLEGYRALTRRIDPILVKFFKTLPRIPYGVEPIPENIAPDTTTAYYMPPAADGSRAGTYYVNLYKPETRPKYEMMALSLHEAVPGHHLQIALAMENEGIPNFRRHGGYTAFVEGWGLYAESLGEAMGLYDNPYSKFGQLMYEMWRAVRLVVDTGIHSMRWDRQKAIDFYLQNTARQELDAVNEIDRYIAMPGQALAYKVGQLKIAAIRRKAEKSLGEKFDVRAFHDAILKEGALPLDILEARMNQWIDQQSR